MDSDGFRSRFARCNDVEAMTREGFGEGNPGETVIVNDEQCFRHLLSMVCEPIGQVVEKRG